MCATRKDNESLDRKLVATRLRQIRKSCDLTQAELAERIGYSREGYANYEREHRALPRRAQRRIIELTGEDPLDFSKTYIAPHQNKRRSSANIYKLCRDLPEIRRRSVADHSIYIAREFSVLGRRWVKLRDFMAIEAALCGLIRIISIEVGLPFGEPVGEVDWILLLSCLAAIVLAPMQIVSFVKFQKWRKRQNFVYS
ncbi:helix-turn-helix transcriptional regulator [Paracoccaceae bacterium GXU_MW_L88]